jgi:hypothetical protein
MNGVPLVHKGAVLGCDWSADESRVLSCGEDGTTRSFLANGSLQCAVPLRLSDPPVPSIRLVASSAHTRPRTDVGTRADPFPAGHCRRRWPNSTSVGNAVLSGAQ